MYAIRSYYDNCNTQMNVFDGKRRFVVKFTDKGDEKIPANNYSNFSGNARLCEMDITPEDGYPRITSYNVCYTKLLRNAR